MNAPIIAISTGYVAVRFGAITIQATRDTFTASVPGQKDVQIRAEKLRKDTDDPYINLVAGMSYIIAKQGQGND